MDSDVLSIVLSVKSEFLELFEKLHAVSVSTTFGWAASEYKAADAYVYY